VRVFIPLSEEDRKIISEIDKKIEIAENNLREQSNVLNDLKDKNENEKEKIQAINLKLLHAKLLLYKINHNKYPGKNEYPKALMPVPVEPFSLSRKIHMVNNGKGGWFYNVDNGTIGPNI